MIFALAGSIGLLSFGASGGAAATRVSRDHHQAATRVLTLQLITPLVSAGDHAILAVRVTRQGRCGLMLQGPGRMHAGPYTAQAQQSFVTWRWTVPVDVRGAAWKARVTCDLGKTASAVHSVIKASASQANRSSLVQRGSMSVTVGGQAPPLAPEPGVQGVVGGKGGGSNYCAPDPHGAIPDAGGYCTGYCTHYVWTRRPDLTQLGNAYQWMGNAQARGIPTGARPVAGAVAWWDAVPNTPLSLGHVAYVESVSGNTFVVSEMNAAAGWNKVDSQPYTVGGKGAPQGFIYGGPAGNGPTGGGAAPPPGGGTPPPPATCTGAACEGKILRGSDGREYWIHGGKRYYIGTPVIDSCIEGRTGSGAPMSATADLINSYADAGRGAWCPYPEGDLVRGNGQTEVWLMHADGTRQHVTCLPANAPVEVVPAGEPDGHVNTGDISLCASPGVNYEGHILLASDGKQFWIKDGKRYYIGTPVISACIQVRASAGAPIGASYDVINAYPDAGRGAWCPYPEGALVQAAGDTKVWRVHADGTREWVTCLMPGTPFSVVPAGEPDGHTVTGQVSLCNFEGKIMLGQDGREYWIHGGQRYYIGTPVIDLCIEGRTGSGAPISATSDMINAYPDAGRSAWCPYPDGSLVREQGDTKIWKAYANGTKQWVTCLPAGTAFSDVPPGETAGHQDIGQVSLCP